MALSSKAVDEMLRQKLGNTGRARKLEKLLEISHLSGWRERNLLGRAIPFILQFRYHRDSIDKFMKFHTIY